MIVKADVLLESLSPYFGLLYGALSESPHLCDVDKSFLQVGHFSFTMLVSFLSVTFSKKLHTLDHGCLDGGAYIASCKSS